MAGVAVSDITMEMRMAMERVKANSQKRRPTMPPINSSGMNTATSEMLIDRTVKLILLRPLQGCRHRMHTLFQVARNVFNNH